MPLCAPPPGRICGKTALQGLRAADADAISGFLPDFLAAFAHGTRCRADLTQMRTMGSISLDQGEEDSEQNDEEQHQAIVVVALLGSCSVLFLFHVVCRCQKVGLEI